MCVGEKRLQNDINGKDEVKKELTYRPLELVYPMVFFVTFIHVVALYGIWACFTSAKWYTIALAIVTYFLSNLGITGGVHRLWAHKSYKAKWPLRFFLVLCNSMAYQNSVIEWSRDHRAHHKYQDTDADPHNINRGFFFAHVGWLMCRKHPQLKSKANCIDMSDLYEDPLLRIQHKYYEIFVWTFCYIIPTAIPMYYWNETFMNSYSVNMLRFVFLLNATWCVNSVAHLWGDKPYNKALQGVENPWVSIFINGEGWHNYHHAFPWDYKAAELFKFNLTASAIYLFSKLGWAYDLKTVSPEMIRNQVVKHGDGSHNIWGWGDKDQTQDNINAAVIQ